MRNGRPETPLKRISLALGVAAFTWLGCGGASEPARHGPGVGLCVEMIEAHVETPRVVTITKPHLGEVRIRFVPGDGAPEAGVATCRWQRTRMGGVRLAFVAIDGRALSDLELLVRNADLLLKDLRVAESYGPRS